MSATYIFKPFMNSPLALNGTCCPTTPAVGPACGTRVCAGVGVGCTTRPPVGLGLGVGVAGIGVPAPITIVARLNPGSAPGLGQTPGSKAPNSLYEPVHPLLPPQLLISRVPATNNTTGAITSHLKRHDIE